MSPDGATAKVEAFLEQHKQTVGRSVIAVLPDGTELTLGQLKVLIRRSKKLGAVLTELDLIANCGEAR